MFELTLLHVAFNVSVRQTPHSPFPFLVTSLDVLEFQLL